MNSSDSSEQISYHNKYKKYKNKYFGLKNHLSRINSDEEKSRLIRKPPQQFLDDAFPDKNGVDKSKLQITNISFYSAGTKITSRILSNIIKQHTGPGDITITDMTANVGSETIRFGMEFDKVNAIEIDPVTCGALKNNVSVYGLTNVNVFCGNSVKIIEELDQSVLYADPPWGGKDYKTLKAMNLELSGVDIVDIIKNNLSRAKIFVLRVPKNYDFNNFYEKLLPNKITSYGIKKKTGDIKFYILVLEPYEIISVN